MCLCRLRASKTCLQMLFFVHNVPSHILPLSVGGRSTTPSLPPTKTLAISGISWSAARHELLRTPLTDDA